MTAQAKPEPARQLLQQAQQTYESGDDKTCAGYLWQKVHLAPDERANSLKQGRDYAAELLAIALSP